MSSAKGFFLTKKQQKLVKERRNKKKKLILADGPGAVVEKAVSLDFVPDQQQQQQEMKVVDGDQPPTPPPPPATTMMTTTSVTTEEAISKNSNKTGKRKRSSDNKKIIYIPDEIFDDPKAVKKFRKEARRNAKRQNDDTPGDSSPLQLTFIKESDRKTRKFPVLKELVQEQQQQKLQDSAAAHSRSNSSTTGNNDDKKEGQPSTAAAAAMVTTAPGIDTSQYIALDCEMVGIGTDGKKSVLARASLVDWDGKCIYDRYVKVPVHVTDFRTKYSGIRPMHLKDRHAVDPTACRNEIAAMLRGKVLVGHALHNDLDVLLLQHSNVRDTAKYRPFQRLSYANKYRPRKLKDLVAEHLQQSIQSGSHDSVQDAAAAMALYQTVHVEWERQVTLERNQKTTKKRKKHGGK